MRLRKLRYPIAIVCPSSLIGGVNAELDTPKHWNSNLVDYYRNGGFNDCRVVDSEGREFLVDKIVFTEISVLYRVVHWLLMRPKSELVRVDMQLSQTRSYTLDEFCTKFRQLALNHPEWWQRHSDREEIEQMFETSETFKDAINDIGVLDPPGREKLLGKSTIEIIDLRKS